MWRRDETRRGGCVVLSSGLTFGSTFTTFFSSFFSSLRCFWLSLSFFFTVLNMASISSLAFSSASFCAFLAFCCRAALWEPGAFIEFCMCAIFCCTTLDLLLFFRPNVASFIFCSCFFFFSAFAWSFWVAFAAFPFFPMVKKPKQPNKKNLTTPEKTYRSRRQINRPLQLHCPKLYFSLCLSFCLWRTLVFSIWSLTRLAASVFCYPCPGSRPTDSHRQAPQP